jgi:hypothetical protein
MNTGMKPHVVPSLGEVDHTGSGMIRVASSVGQSADTGAAGAESAGAGSAAAGAASASITSSTDTPHMRTLVRAHAVAGMLQFAGIGAVVTLACKYSACEPDCRGEHDTCSGVGLS